MPDPARPVTNLRADASAGERGDGAFKDSPWLDPNAKPFIEIEGLTKYFGDFCAVDSVVLSIFKGELFSMLGASGCSKITLLRMLAGFYIVFGRSGHCQFCFGPGRQHTSYVYLFAS